MLARHLHRLRQRRLQPDLVRIGLMPDGGSKHSCRNRAATRILELMATGASSRLTNALRLGIVNRVVRHSELDATVDETAARLAAAPQPSLARIKAALSRADHERLAAALDFEAEGQAECFRSADFIEGVTAFMQKRAPEFGKRSK